MNADEQSEWTCVHDIQEMADPYQHQKKVMAGGVAGASSSSGSSSYSGHNSAFVDQEDEYDAVKRRVAEQFAELRQQVLDHVEEATSESGAARAKMYLKKVNRFLTLLGTTDTSVPLPVVESTSFDMWSGQMTDNRFDRNSSIGPIRSGLISARVVENALNPELTSADGIYLSSEEDEEEEEEDEEEDDSDDDSEVEDAQVANDVLLQMHVDEIGTSDNEANEESSQPDPVPSSGSSRGMGQSDKFYAFVGNRLAKLIDELRVIQKHMNNKYKTNKPRLLHYAKESNAGKGYIKEICFSSDGRVIASPYGNGVRLMAFNPKCQELCDCVESWCEPQKPKELSQVVVDLNSHSNLVVCTKFSPNYPLLVSGCLRGSIVWHYPKL